VKELTIAIDGNRIVIFADPMALRELADEIEALRSKSEEVMVGDKKPRITMPIKNLSDGSTSVYEAEFTYK